MYIQRCRKYSPTRQMRVKILMDELKNAASSPTGDLYFLFFNFLLLLFFFSPNPPLRIIHARISNNLNNEFIMMTKFTIHVQSQRSFVFKNSQLSYFARLLQEFVDQSRFLCRVSVDFGSRLLSMVLLSKSFHNVVIFLLQLIT